MITISTRTEKTRGPRVASLRTEGRMGLQKIDVPSTGNWPRNDENVVQEVMLGEKMQKIVPRGSQDLSRGCQDALKRLQEGLRSVLGAS